MQGIKIFLPLAVCSVVVAFLLLMGRARAEIFPVHGTTVYSASSPTVPLFEIDAVGGSAYVLTLQPESNYNSGVVDFVYLVMRPAGADDSVRNLLEPKVWHGYQDFMLAGWDYEKGAQNSRYGATRNFNLKKAKVNVRVSVINAVVRPIEARPTPIFSIDELVLDIDVTNLR